MVEIRVSVADAAGAARLLRRLAADGHGSVVVSNSNRTSREPRSSHSFASTSLGAVRR